MSATAFQRMRREAAAKAQAISKAEGVKEEKPRPKKKSKKAE